MSSPEDAGAGRCPGCGAPSDEGASGVEGPLRCAYCGYALRRLRPSPVVAAPRPRAAVPSPTRRVLTIYAGVVGVAVVIGAIVNLRVSRSPTARHALRTVASFKERVEADNGVSKLLAVIPRADGGADLLTSLDKDGSHAVGLFDGRTHQLRWRDGAFAKYMDRELVARDATRVFVLDDPRLTAISLKDGSELWQASLLTELTTSCDGCLRVIKDRVVASQKDGTLQAFDAATGRVVWSLRTERAPRRLFAVGDNLIVEHIVVGRKDKAEIDVVDPTDGSTIRAMQPSCINSAFHQPERPDDGTPLLFDESGKTMYTIFGFFSHCAQAWDVATGQRRWNTYVPDWDTSGQTVLGTHALMFESGAHGVAALDVATGKRQTLVADKEFTIKPLYGQGDEVVVKAAPHWDSDKVALWGLDATTGTKRWQFPLSAERLSMDAFSDYWAWWRTPAGLVLLQKLAGDKTSLDIVDSATGVSRGRKIVAGASYYQPTLGDDLVWVPVRSGIDAITLPDGAVAYHLR